MLLIAYLSQILYSIMFAVVFKSPKFWIVFSCHQFINKSVASFYNFRYFFNLSFLYFLIKYFFILSVICSICFFSSLSYIKLFIGLLLSTITLLTVTLLFVLLFMLVVDCKLLFWNLNSISDRWWKTILFTLFLLLLLLLDILEVDVFFMFTITFINTCTYIFLLSFTFIPITYYPYLLNAPLIPPVLLLNYNYTGIYITSNLYGITPSIIFTYILNSSPSLYVNSYYSFAFNLFSWTNTYWDSLL